jgi:hypothetical protein
MRKVLSILGLLILASVVVFAVESVSFAECPPGKVLVTIVNPAGKVVEVCVPGDVVDKIGGPKDIVVAAICPCFSQEDVEAALNDNPDIVCQQYDGTAITTTGETESCTYVRCGSYVESYESPEEGKCDFGGPLPAFRCLPGSNWCSIDDQCLSLSPEEADACVAILKTFVP